MAAFPTGRIAQFHLEVTCTLWNEHHPSNVLIKGAGGVCVGPIYIITTVDPFQFRVTATPLRLFPELCAVWFWQIRRHLHINWLHQTTTCAISTRARLYLYRTHVLVVAITQPLNVDWQQLITAFYANATYVYRFPFYGMFRGSSLPLPHISRNTFLLCVST